MEKYKTYAIINKFECCGKIMLTVKIKNSVCVMLVEEYNRISVECNLECLCRSFGLEFDSSEEMMISTMLTVERSPQMFT